MKTEIVVRSPGSRIQTQQDLRSAAGNVIRIQGEAVYVLDGVVLGQSRRRGKGRKKSTS